MRQKSNTPETPSERLVRDIRRATRKQYSAEEKIRIVLDGLRGEVTIADSAAGKACREPVLQLVERVPGSWQATARRRHGAVGDHQHALAAIRALRTSWNGSAAVVRLENRSVSS